ncbi:predicted protein [Scheffersomyces stipitis CBS 6054]|uniref:Alpha/beta hydrolase fold-3 domain-containing protein n=1 Tax=Scheffersomyces stipitis (strain ATCC 58785 / CBS 6054 / NBRC 10063 / NRRL Y-11545) TaxID=322104 RepID=A3LVU9_PICST|nr:predicted protein [Scheffersomyces stipitis CBS 6054]ABN66845.2 predicted protein [Scheffersomyces stipitis CBS 6054]
MQTFGHRDLVLYFLLTTIIITYDGQFFQFLFFLVQNSPFLIVKFPYIYLTRRIVCAFPFQSNFSQRATNSEYLVVQMLRYLYKILPMSSTARIFLDQRVFEILHRIRRIREFNDGLGDILFSRYSNVGEGQQDTEGLWIYSKSRADTKPHDILVLYVHGGAGFGRGTSHMYTEYLSIFTLNLLEQGFSNPGIYVPTFPDDKFDKYPHQLGTVLKAYEYLTSISNENCHLAVMGDSSGATLCLSLLLTLAEPSPMLVRTLLASQKEKLKIETTEQLAEYYQNLKKPAVALLVSPITNLFTDDTGSLKSTTSKDDYLSVQVVRGWAQEYLQDSLYYEEYKDSELAYFDPGQVQDKTWWKRAMPKYGMLISYGSEELLAPEIETFISKLSDEEIGSKIRVDKQDAQVHNWGLLAFYTERLIDHREVSLQIFSSVISRMLLWNTVSYFDSGAKHPTNIVTIDEDYV